MRTLSALTTLLFLGCATPGVHFESPRLPDRWPSLRTLGLVGPVVDVSQEPADPKARDAWKREAEEGILVTFAAEIQMRGIAIVRLSPKPPTHERLAALARRFDEAALAVGRSEKPAEALAAVHSLGDQKALARASAVDGFLVTSATALPPRGPPRPSAFSGLGRTTFQSIQEAEEGPGLTGDAGVRLSWLAAAVVDASGEILWMATRGAPGEDEGDEVRDFVADLAERLPQAR